MKDPAISANETGYEPYDLGIQDDIFIKDEFGNLRYGKVSQIQIILLIPTHIS